MELLALESGTSDGPSVRRPCEVYGSSKETKNRPHKRVGLLRHRKRCAIGATSLHMF